jgi:uncharacterized membrane protein
VSQRFNSLMNDNRLWYQYAKQAWTIVGEGYSSERDYKALIKEHCTPSFTLIGEAEGFFKVDPCGITADGSTAIVNLYNVGSRTHSICRWTKEGGVKEVDALKKFYYASAAGISSDGGTIFGYRQLEKTEKGEGLETFRYTQDKLEILEPLEEWERPCARKVNANGSAIVGHVKVKGLDKQVAWLWTREEGLKSLAALNTSEFFSTAAGISADGSVIIGNTKFSELGPTLSFRYTKGEGIKFLDYLPKHTSSNAHAISANGLVIVGSSYAHAGGEAVKWTLEEGTQSLGDGIAFAVNEDGSRIAGWTGHPLLRKAFLWEGGKGMQFIQELLDAQEPLPAGWILTEANSMTPDGTVFVGRAKGEGESIHRELAWRAVIPRAGLF